MWRTRIAPIPVGLPVTLLPVSTTAEAHGIIESSAAQLRRPRYPAEHGPMSSTTSSGRSVNQGHLKLPKNA